MFVRDDAGVDWFRALEREGINYTFIKGGYGMQFYSKEDYAKAKDFAKRVGMSTGHWYDRDLTYFDFGSSVVGNDSACKFTDRAWGMGFGKITSPAGIAYQCHKWDNKYVVYYFNKSGEEIVCCSEDDLDVAEKNIKSGAYDSMVKRDPLFNDAVSIFTVSFKSDGVHQTNEVRASSEEEAKEKFMAYKNKAGTKIDEIYGIRAGSENKPGQFIIDGSVDYDKVDYDLETENHGGVVEREEAVRTVRDDDLSDLRAKVAEAKARYEKTDDPKDMAKYRSLLRELNEYKSVFKDSELKILERSGKNALIYREGANTPEPYVYARGFNGYEWDNGTYFKTEKAARDYWKQEQERIEREKADSKQFSVKDSKSGRVFHVLATDSLSAVQKVSRLLRDSIKDSTEKTYAIYNTTPFGRVKVIEWKTDVPADRVVEEFLEYNPAYKNKGSISAQLVDSLGDDVKKYQEWVDYDMKRYGKISEKTNEELRKAGLKVVKDKYGDYEVIV